MLEFLKRVDCTDDYTVFAAEVYKDFDAARKIVNDVRKAIKNAEKVHWSERREAPSPYYQEDIIGN